MSAPGTPSQQAPRSRKPVEGKRSARKKLPLGDDDDASKQPEEKLAPATPPKVSSRRITSDSAAAGDAATPAKAESATKSEKKSGKQLAFGSGAPPRLKTIPAVQRMYKVVNKCTGSLGGNGSGGAIYGELTQASMQKVANLMVTHGELTKDSVFVDVGSGLGKPNLHVAIEPGVKHSVGIEMEHVRWMLSMHNLRHVIDDAVTHAVTESSNCDALKEDTLLGTTNCLFMHADMFNAKSFNPFTHVYMFDIGMPPSLFLHMAECLRSSTTATHLLCYHAPATMIGKYGFEMEFIEKQATSMHGSSEGHTAYLYRCTHKVKKGGKKNAAAPQSIAKVSDALFAEGFEVLSEKEGSGVSAWVSAKLSEDERMSGKSLRPRTRAQAKTKEAEAK